MPSIINNCAMHALFAAYSSQTIFEDKCPDISKSSRLNGVKTNKPDLSASSSHKTSTYLWDKVLAVNQTIRSTHARTREDQIYVSGTAEGQLRSAENSVMKDL